MRKISLKNLAFKHFGCIIQKDGHNSVDDAKICLALARLRIDIIDNINYCIQKDFEKKYEFYELLQEIEIKIIAIDLAENIGFANKGNQIKVKNGSLDEVFTVLGKLKKLNKKNIKIARVTNKNTNENNFNNFLSEFDAKLEELFKISEENTDDISQKNCFKKDENKAFFDNSILMLFKK